MSKEKNKQQQGQLLMEAVLAIAIIGILASFVTSLVSVSVRSNQASGKQSVALALAQEVLVAARAIKDTNDTTSRGWNKIYELNEEQDYHLEDNAGSWEIVASSEEVTVDGVTYTRKINFDVTIDRDETNGGGDIAVSGSADPATVKTTVTVTATGIPDIILSEYLTRAKNETKVWSSDDADDPSSGDGFKSTGAECDDTKVLGTGADANIELSSGSSC